MIKDFIIVIPARFNSSRFEGKPLCILNGKTMIMRVYEKCLEAVNDSALIYVATDSQKIFDHCSENKMNVIMTSSQCLTGTDRLGEVSQKIPAHFYINVQGDEPLINSTDILKVIDEAKISPNQIINAMTEIKDKEEFYSPNVPKVVFNLNNELMYMSRAGIPTNKKHEFVKSYKQVCIYSFPKQSLDHFCLKQSKTPVENIEDIEILRFLEMGYKVKMVEVSGSSIAVDTPADARKVDEILKRINS